MASAIQLFGAELQFLPQIVHRVVRGIRSIASGF
jgi:hypothetical protein